MAFVSNSTIPPWTIIALQRGLVDLLARRPLAPQSPASTALAETSSADRSMLSGRYAAPGLGLVHLSWNGKGLQLQPEGGLQLDAYPVSRSVFYVPGNDWWIAFGRGAGDDPRPSRLHVRSMYFEADATRLPN